MGLFDGLFNMDQRTALSLLSAAGPSREPSSFGQRLFAGLMQADQLKAQEEERKQRGLMQALQMDMHRQNLGDAQEQAAERKRAREQAMTDETLLRTHMTPLQGPMPDGSAIPQRPFDPRQFLAQGGSAPGVMNALQLNAAMQPPKPKTVTLKPGEHVFEEGGRQLFGLPDKPAELPSGVREYEYAKGQGFPGTFEQWQLAQKRAGASSVSVNTGQKGLDNTLKLRGDFRSEPIYKAHQEMQSAYSQIQQSLKQASPAGDLAGATKIMKLLDPGSVVRESELGMAMAASGALDRLTYYAENIIKGTKLNPNQRKDFQTLADALYGESVKQYNAKRGEYEGIAKRNGLSVEDVLGNAAAGPQSTAPADRVRRYNPATGMIE